MAAARGPAGGTGPPRSGLKLQLPSLDTGPLPLGDIRDQARRQLLEIVDSRRGSKALLIEPSLAGPLSLLDVGLVDMLAEHGVARVMYLEDTGRDKDSTSTSTNSTAAKPGAAGSKAASAAPLAPVLAATQGAAGSGDIRSAIMLLRPTVANAQLVARQARAARTGRAPGLPPLDLSVCWVPRRTATTDKLLQQEGVYADLAIGEFPLLAVPYDDDLLSLELQAGQAGGLVDCIAHGDPTPLHATAMAIMALQRRFGLVPRMQGKGPAAAAVRDMLARMRRESPPPPPPPAGSGVPRIVRCVLIDREVDMVTPLMTQLTFEGLMDEVVGIRAGAVQAVQTGGTTVVTQAKELMPGSVAAAPSTSTSTSSGAGGLTLLNSSDPLYRELRDLPFHICAARLQAYAREAKREYQQLGAKDISGLKTFVKGLPKLASLDRLSDLATPLAQAIRGRLFHERLRAEVEAVEGADPDTAASFVEELMCRGASLPEVLRLVVLLAAAQGGQGLPRRTLDALRAELLATYGHEHVATLNTLEKSGLLRPAVGGSAAGRAQFAAVRRALRLIVPQEELDLGMPADPAAAGSAGGGGGTTGNNAIVGGFGNDIATLYRGYAPLSIRLVEVALSTSWGPLAEVLLALPGPHFDVLQGHDAIGAPQDKPFRQQQQQATTGGASAAPGTSPSPSQHGTDASSSGGASQEQASSSGASGGAGSGAAAAGGGGGTVGLSAASASASSSSAFSEEVVVVVFLGGVTFAEVSALRLMQSRPGFPYRFVVLTTQVVNGRTLLQPFVDRTAAALGQCIGLQV